MGGPRGNCVGKGGGITDGLLYAEIAGGGVYVSGGVGAPYGSRPNGDGQLSDMLSSERSRLWTRCLTCSDERLRPRDRSGRLVYEGGDAKLRRSLCGDTDVDRYDGGDSVRLGRDASTLRRL